MLIANIKTHKLKKKKAIIPILILVVLWITNVMIIQYTGIY